MMQLNDSDNNVLILIEYISGSEESVVVAGHQVVQHEHGGRAQGVPGGPQRAALGIRGAGGLHRLGERAQVAFIQIQFWRII